MPGEMGDELRSILQLRHTASMLLKVFIFGKRFQDFALTERQADFVVIIIVRHD